MHSKSQASPGGAHLRNAGKHFAWSRRTFLKSSMAATGWAVLSSSWRSLGAEVSSSLRTITYNVYGCHGYATSKEAEPFVERAERQIPLRVAMELELYRPDIVTFQEAPSQQTIAAIAKHMNFRYGYFPSFYKSKREDSVGFPGAILTRFEIVSLENCPLGGKDRPEELFTRHWGKAVLKTTRGELVVYSAHLHPSEDAVRAREVHMMLEAMQADLRGGVPLLLQGDFNHVPEGPEYRLWKEAGLLDAGNRGVGSFTHTFVGEGPSKRIDYIWSHGGISATLRSCKVLNEGAFRAHEKDPHSFALSDHLPVLAEFGW